MKERIEHSTAAGRMTPAAVGFRAHSGWAALVAIAAPAHGLLPSVIDRRRIELVAPGVPTQPYHAAAALDLKEAEKLVRRCGAEAKRLAYQVLGDEIDDLRERGHNVVGCGIPLACGRPLPPIAATLASHALIHTAEGELFRDAVAWAGTECGLRVTRVRERELYTRGASALRLPVDELRRRAAELGRPLGPPWRLDEKNAALVGWLALAAG